MHLNLDILLCLQCPREPMWGYSRKTVCPKNLPRESGRVDVISNTWRRLLEEKHGWRQKYQVGKTTNEKHVTPPLYPKHSQCERVWPGESRSAFFQFEKQSSRLNNFRSMYFSSTCVTWTHCQSFSGILVICPQSVFPSAPLTSVTSITSGPRPLSHERQSIIAY